MAQKKYIELLNSGRDSWNYWMNHHYPKGGRVFEADNVSQALAQVSDPDLSGYDLANRNLKGYDFRYTDFSGANLTQTILSATNLYKANLKGANLRRSKLDYVKAINADFSKADCSEINLSNSYLVKALFVETNLISANVSSSDLTRSNFSGANLRRANLKNSILDNVRLRYSSLVESNLSNAKINGCAVFGASIWETNLDGADQKNFVITPDGQNQVIVDNIEIGQFIYLLLQNQKIRSVIDTISAKAVLILGSFGTGYKEVLDVVKSNLRARGYLPILFDFAGPESRDLTETISTLAHIARFIVADLSDPRSVPHELLHIIPRLPSVPVQPIINASSEGYKLFEHFKPFTWVLNEFRYTDTADIEKCIDSHIIGPVENYIHDSGKTE